MQLSDRVNRIEVSATLAVLLEKEKLVARGIDVADFGPGEPDFPTPANIKRAAIQAIEANKTKYTATSGIMPLRQAVCEWHEKNLGSAYEPKECIINAGGKQALFNTIHALINSGDEVLIASPYWVSYPDIVKCADGVPVFLPTHAEDQFILRAGAVEKAITARTKILIVNSPCNPTGSVIPPEEFARLLEVCVRRNLWLVTDECYSHFVYDEAKPFSIASLPGAKERVIVAGSLSKTFAMTGWRIGYTLGPAPLIEATLKLQSQSTSNATTIAQYAALEALQGGMESVSGMIAEFARRRTRILEGLRKIAGVECLAPQGTFYVFPNVANCAACAQKPDGTPDTLLMARELLEREHVVVIPGEAFGAAGYLRVSYATSTERIEEGLRRLNSFFRTTTAVSAAASHA
jgi:aspartate aminotransferase